MKPHRFPLLMVLLLALAGRADGLIVVHEPFPLPRPIPPPQPPPWPRPPQPLPPPPRVFSFAPLEVTFHQVEARIRDQVAVTTVDQEFYNPNDRQLEGTYLFPVPKGAQIDKFSMDVNGRPMEAELLSAEKARQIYEDIVRRHRDPALLEYVGRDLFKVRIFPIEPRSKKRVKLSYTQLLEADGGLVNYVYPLNTEKYSARPIPNISLKVDLETRRPLKAIYSPSHNVEIRRSADHRATVGFEAKDVKPDTDFQLLYATDSSDLGVNLLSHRTGTDDGFFLLLATPAFELKDRRAVAKDVVFVLDTSGSMAGRKLEQARKALLFCVENLNDQDRFEIVRFATDLELGFDRLVDASRANRDRAADFIRDLKPTGGTAIHDALKKALALRPETGDRPYFVIFLTDGLPTVGVTDNDAIVAAVKEAAKGTTRVFCFGIGTDVNTHLLDRVTETTHATSAYVLPDEDLEVKVSTFFSKIKEPVLANVKLAFPEDVRVSRLYPSPLPDLFKGEQLVVVGRYQGAGRGRLLLEGTADGARQEFRYDVELAEKGADHDFIPRLWATRRIGYLLDEIRLRGESSELRDEVTELARKYSIVTPYTAYLIHEDEQQRGVPLAQQSVPLFSTDGRARTEARYAWDSFKRDASGGAAVANARLGLAQRSANQVSDALQTANAEAERSFRYLAAAPTGAPVPATAGAATGRPVATSAAAPAPSGTPVQLAQQTRFVGGRSFFQNGNQWIDTEIQKLKTPKVTRVTFNSSEYFDLALKHPEVRPWLALSQNVQFALGGQVYEIVE